MNLATRLIKLLVKAGLSREESIMYWYVSDHPGCSIMDVVRDGRIPKTTAYRAFECLKSKKLLETSASGWRNCLRAVPITSLLHKLQNEQINRRRLIHELELMCSLKKIPEAVPSMPQIETTKGDEALQKYLDLSEMEWRSNLSFGNWEDLNQNGHLIPLEKKFITNRLKKGANAYCHVMKSGPCTREITDYDAFQNRISKTLNRDDYKPLWINTFEGNSYVYMWTLDEKRTLVGTFIDSKPVADFYRNYTYSLLK